MGTGKFLISKNVIELFGFMYVQRIRVFEKKQPNIEIAYLVFISITHDKSNQTLCIITTILVFAEINP